MSKYQKGISFELEESKQLHKNHVPFLISSALLRSHNCGQVDIAYVKKGTLILSECKSNGLMNHSQYKRLTASQAFLSIILDIPVFIEFRNAR